MAAHFEEPDFARRNLKKVSLFAPAYAEMTRLAGQLIEDRMGEAGRLLVIGAGGSRKLTSLAGVRRPDRQTRSAMISMTSGVVITVSAFASAAAKARPTSSAH